jgi:hypothetical protein
MTQWALVRACLWPRIDVILSYAIPWGIQNLQPQNSNLFAYDLHNSSCVTVPPSDFVTLCGPISQCLEWCLAQRLVVVRSCSRISVLCTFCHTTSQTVSSSSSLGNYCCRRTQHMVSSYPSFCHNIKHNSQHVFQNLFDSLGLYIILRVISRTKI